VEKCRIIHDLEPKIVETCTIEVNGLDVQIVRKDIKNLHLGVYPPDGRVRVAVPLAMSNDAVRLAVIHSLGWIKQEQASFEAQPRQLEREMMTSESHYFLGKRYRLRVVTDNGPAKIVRQNAFLELHAPATASMKQRQRILQQWYRQELKQLIPPLLLKWQGLLGIADVHWGIRRMKTKWGSCNPTARHILFNLELAKKPMHCLEYILVHELVHLFYRKHDKNFYAMLTRLMPKWQLYRDQLNDFILSHERWK